MRHTGCCRQKLVGDIVSIDICALAADSVADSIHLATVQTNCKAAHDKLLFSTNMPSEATS